MIVKKQAIDFKYEILRILRKQKLIIFNEDELVEGKKLGSGGYGKIVTSTFKSLKFAIKKLKEFNPKELYNEITILKKFSFPRIPRFLGLINNNDYNNDAFSQSLNPQKNEVKKFEENLLGIDVLVNETKIIKSHSAFIKTNLNIDIVEELVEGKTLREIGKENKLSELEKLLILVNLCNVLEYLHDKNVIHRDLKPENIMINNKFELKLLDFGISKISFSGSTKTMQVGTMSYMAPENFIISNQDDEDENQNEDHNQKMANISVKVDVWAFGCIVQELMTGVKPWSNKVKSDMKIMALLYKKVNFEVTNLLHKDDPIRNIVVKCTEVDPNKRTSIKDIKIDLYSIIFDKFKKNFYFDKSVKFSEGILKIYTSLENISSQAKFGFFKQFQEYLEDYLRILSKNVAKKPSKLASINYLKKLSNGKIKDVGRKLLEKYSQIQKKDDELDIEIKQFLDKANILEEEKKMIKEKEKEKKFLKGGEYIEKLINGEINFSNGKSILKKSSRFDYNNDILNENEHDLKNKNVKFFETFVIPNLTNIESNKKKFGELKFSSNTVFSFENIKINQLFVQPTIELTYYADNIKKADLEISKINTFLIKKKKKRSLKIRNVENFTITPSENDKELELKFNLEPNQIKLKKIKFERKLNLNDMSHIKNRHPQLKVLSQVSSKKKLASERGIIYVKFPDNLELNQPKPFKIFRQKKPNNLEKSFEYEKSSRIYSTKLISQTSENELPLIGGIRMKVNKLNFHSLNLK